jgi:hypothetical protein
MLSIDILTSIKILSPYEGGHLEFALLVSSHAPTYELCILMFIYTLFGLTNFKNLLYIQSLGLKVNCVRVNRGNGYELFFNLSFHAFVRTSQEM